jgi:hypothetical protein
MPDIRRSVESYAGLTRSLATEMAGLSGALPAVTVPFGFVAGVGRPVPVAQAARA